MAVRVLRPPIVLAGRACILAAIACVGTAALPLVSLAQGAPGPSPRWVSLGPANIPGSIHSISFDPKSRKVIYLGIAGGGVWRTRDDGASWTPLGDELPTLEVSATCLVPRDPRIVIAGTGDAVLGNDWIPGKGIVRSTDAGRTWSRTNVVTDVTSRRNGYHAIEANPVSGVILAAGVSGLLRSVDDGATWEWIDSLANWTDVKWRPGSADSAYAVKELGGVYVSGDGGRSFHHMDGGLPADETVVGLSRLAVTRCDPAYVYASFSRVSDDIPYRVYRSTDGGASWSLRSGSRYLDLATPWNSVLSVNPSDPNDVLAGGFGLNRSRDGGLSWVETGGPSLEPNVAVYRPGSPQEVWLATDRGVFRSLDGGDTWQGRYQGLVALEIYHVCSAKGTSSLAYAGSQYWGTPRYVGEMNWQLTGGDGASFDGMVCNIDPRDPRHVYGENQDGLHFVSVDGLTTTWHINNGLYGEGRFVTPVDMDPSDANRLFTATNAGIFRTTTGGAQWEWVGEGQDIVSISVSPVSVNWVWALERSSGVVRVSRDGGSIWAPFQAAPFALIAGTTIVADPADSLGAFCAFRAHPLHPPVIIRTRDAGRTWQDVSGNLQGQSVNTLAIDPSRSGDWYAGTQVGVWRSQDGGASWFRFGKGLPNAVVMDLEILDGERLLRVGTYGRGVWEAPLPRGSARSATPRTRLVLESTEVSPGRGVVSFRYGGTGPVALRLRVFDVRGRMISEVAAAPADGVVRVATWHAHGAAAGVYFAELTSGGARLVRKIVVVH